MPMKEPTPGEPQTVGESALGKGSCRCGHIPQLGPTSRTRWIPTYGKRMGKPLAQQKLQRRPTKNWVQTSVDSSTQSRLVLKLWTLCSEMVLVSQKRWRRFGKTGIQHGKVIAAKARRCQGRRRDPSPRRHPEECWRGAEGLEEFVSKMVK